MNKNNNIGCLMCVTVLCSIVTMYNSNRKRDEKTNFENSTLETSISTLETHASSTLTIVTTTTTTATIATSYKSEPELLYLGKFTGTYYKGDTYPCNGGSGRELISCDVKTEEYKGSVASRYVYENLGYYVNDKTIIFITFETYPELNGLYSVDDCNSDTSIIDFYFNDYDNCPWKNIGVISCEAWIGG